MSRRQQIGALALGAALLFSCAGCGPAAEPPGEETTTPQVSAPTQTDTKTCTLALGYAALDSLHPLEASDRSNLDVISLVYEGLYETDESFAPQPVLAADARESEDGLTWTVTLREGAAFSDGTPLEAAHVVSSLKAAKKGGRYVQRLSGVASVKEKDGEVVITLTAPNGNLPALLAVPILLEREEGLPLGTGPYVLDGGEEELWLAANPNWWQGRRPAFDRIPLCPTGHLDERVSAFDSGQITAVTTDPTAPNALGYSSIYESYDFPTTDMLFVGFHTADGPCADPLVRAALSRAFDRASVVTAFLDGHGAAATLPLSPYSGEYPAEMAETLEFDRAAAEALLAEAGYTGGEDGLLRKKKQTLSLRFVVNQDSLVKQQIARFLAEDLRQLGVDVTVAELGWDDFNAALAAGDFDLWLGEVSLTADFDCSALLKGALNFGQYANEDVFALYDGWKGASGAARTAAGQAAFSAFGQDMPFAVLCFKNDSLCIRWGMVKNLSPVEGAPFRGVENWSAERE